MSIFLRLKRHLCPRATMASARRQWQALESRLSGARERLDRDFHELRRQAEQVQLATDKGVLRAARLHLEQPLDPAGLMVKERLARIFARPGMGRLWPVPSLLAAELADYAANLEKTCRSYGELGARLRLAQAMLLICARHPEFCRPHGFRLALIAPESAWLLFHLRQQRLKALQG